MFLRISDLIHRFYLVQQGEKLHDLLTATLPNIGSVHFTADDNKLLIRYFSAEIRHLIQSEVILNLTSKEIPYDM